MHEMVSVCLDLEYGFGGQGPDGTLTEEGTQQ
jgi:hypothetical protein